MSDIVCVTNRALCAGDFLQRIEEIAAARPAAILLREKDLPPAAYRELAAQVLEICKAQGVPCILHSFVDVALELDAEAIHLPLPLLRGLSAAQRARFPVLGTSCHSAEEAREAWRLGCTYLTAGHVFATDCKKGLPGRGLEFLRSVCESVPLPVYAIGGVTGERMPAVRHAGAKGACVMSGLMQCRDVAACLRAFSETT